MIGKNLGALTLAFLLSSAVAFGQETRPGTAPAQAKPDPQDTTESKDKKAKKDRRGFRWTDHPSLVLGKGTYVDFRARVQTHGMASEAPLRGDDPSSFDLARRRVGLDGRVGGVLDFQVEGELGADDPWRDVFVNYRQFETVRVKAGQFKLPFSLDENTGATNLDFVYRSRAATQLAPGRDRGAMVHGRVIKRVVEYELGLFDHDGDNARTNNPEKVYGGETIAGRIRLQPFRASKSMLDDLQFGVAATGSDVPEGIAGLRGRTVLDRSFFPSAYWVRGERKRIGVEFRWRPGPFSVKSEYMRATTERRSQSVENTDLPPLVGSGWYVSGTWLLTGEKKVDGGDAPRRPLFRGGFGAVEVAARIEELRFRSRATGDLPSSSPRAEVIAGNRDRATTVGLNWFPIRGIKVQANLVREVLSDPSSGPLPSQPGFWSRVIRFQFTL